MISWIDKNYLQMAKRFNRGHFPHAIIISAPHGAGKLELAKQLGQFVLCQQKNDDVACGSCKQCLLIRHGTHPDLLMLESEGKSISVDTVRQVTNYIQKKPQLAQAQIVIINGVEKLTESAANALLKTLEEPTANTFILMTCADIGQLLPTIISRCQIEQIALPVGKALNQFRNTEFVVNQFSNFYQLPEIIDEVVYRDFCDSMQAFAGWLTAQNDSIEAEQVLLQNEHGLRWLEWLIASLQRKKACVDIQIPIKDNLLQAIAIQYDVSALFDLQVLVAKTLKSLKLVESINRNFAVQELVLDINVKING